MHVFVVDAGGDTWKCGSAQQQQPSILLPSCAFKHKRDSKWSLGDLLGSLSDYSNVYLKRCYAHGYVYDWDLTCQLGSRLWALAAQPQPQPQPPQPNQQHTQQISNAQNNAHNNNQTSSASSVSSPPSSSVCKPVSTCLLWSCAPFEPLVSQRHMDEIIYEQWQFAAARRMNSFDFLGSSRSFPTASSTGPSLLVDSGFSFTHVVPLLGSRPLLSVSSRIDVGGKLLTNYLKECVSYRQWNMMEETIVINQVKEKVCYVSLEFERELQRAKRSRKYFDTHLRVDYILPNGSTRLQGLIKTQNTPSLPNDQLLTLSSERIAVPELLFYPSDVGLYQRGIVESIAHVVEQCEPWMRQPLLENIKITGGNIKFKNFKERIERELRPLVSPDYNIQVHVPNDPISACWNGGAALGSAPGFVQQHAVTRQEYQEKGTDAIVRRFEGDQ